MSRIYVPPCRSSFNTYQLNPVGAPGGVAGAIQIVEAYGRPRRVVIDPVTSAATYFLATTIGELDTRGMVTPAQAFVFPGTTGPFVITLGPEQSLYAVRSAAFLARLAVHVSDAFFPGVGDGKRDYEGVRPAARMAPTRVSTVTLTAANRVEIAGWGRRARRVVVQPQVGLLGTIFVSDKEALLSNAHEIASDAARVFIIQPDQQMFANSGGGAALVSVSVLESEIPYGGVVGPTGIPGPGGQE